jgi:hypothetical protein
MKQTDFDTIIPDEDLSDLSLGDAYDQACDSEDFLLCAAERLQQQDILVTSLLVGKELRKILTDQTMQKLINVGKIAYNKDTKTFRSVKQEEA